MHKLKLVKVGKHKIQVIKLIRMFTQLGLKESKELVDNVPSTLISYREDISLEQIIKNFIAIGALVEKVHEETINEPKNDAIGPDHSYSTQQPGIDRQIIKDYQKKNSETNSITTPKGNYQNKFRAKLKLKPAIIFAITIAVIKSLTKIYIGYIVPFYVIFFVAIGIAYLLRKYNLNADKEIGLPAFLITISYFFAIRIIDAIILYTLYQYVVPFDVFGLFISLFASSNFLVLLAAIIAYFLAINKVVFRKFYKGTSKTKSELHNFIENEEIKNSKEKKRF